MNTLSETYDQCYTYRLIIFDHSHTDYYDKIYIRETYYCGLLWKGFLPVMMLSGFSIVTKLPLCNVLLKLK